jgi:hypothetical protein
MDTSGLDFSTQQEELLRRQKLVDALWQGQPLQAGMGTTGPVWNAVSNLLGKSNAFSQQAQLTQDTANFRKQYSQALGNETNQYMDRMNGKPQGDMAADGYGPQTPPVAPNPREAVIRAMTSQLPEMQAMGKASMASAMKPQEVKEHVIGDTLVATNGQGKLVSSQQFNKAGYGPIEQMGTGSDGKPLFGQRDARTGEVKFAPAGQTINIDNKGITEVQKDTIPVLKSARETVITAQSGLQAAERVMQLVDDPAVQTGFGASAAMGLAAIGAQLGFNGPEGAAKTQALATEMAAKTLSMTKQLTGSISDKEKPFLEQVVAGKIDFTPQVIKHVAALTYQANHNAIMNATDQYSSAKTIPGMGGAEKLYPLPPLSWNQPQKGGQDDPALQLDRNSRMQYDGSYLKGATPKRRASDSSGQRKVISYDDFMKGQ